MIERDIISNVKKVSKVFGERIKQTNKNNWFISNGRSVGLIGAIEFGYDKNKKFDIKKKIAAQSAKVIQDNGVILRSLPGDVIGFCPPLIISEAQVNEMFDKIDDSMAAIRQIAENCK